MPFKKGEIGNPQGRKPGSKNKINQKIREQFRQLIEDNFDQIKKDLDELKPRERLEILLKMAQFVLPRLQTIQILEMPEVAELLEMDKETRQAELSRLKAEINGNSPRLNN
jgi:hypothetical protein